VAGAEGTGAGDTAQDPAVDLTIDTSVAHPARVYDYWLGGKDNFAADREAAERVLAVTPGLRWRVQANRRFLARAVRYLAGEAGIRQFLDIGTGIPSANNTHQVGQEVAPDARIVYVDNDPIVLSHARALLTSGPRVLHLIQDSEDPWGLVAWLMAQLPAGSYLAISHPAIDIGPGQAEAQRRYNERVSTPQTLRSHDQVARFFEGLELVEPGLVYVHAWRPGEFDDAPEGATSAWGGVARKP
jgi:hypothetical protein